MGRNQHPPQKKRFYHSGVKVINPFDRSAIERDIRTHLCMATRTHLTASRAFDRKCLSASASAAAYQLSRDRFWPRKIEKHIIGRPPIYQCLMRKQWRRYCSRLEGRGDKGRGRGGGESDNVGVIPIICGTRFIGCRGPGAIPVTTTINVLRWGQGIMDSGISEKPTLCLKLERF